MKFRIISILILALVLGATYLVSESDSFESKPTAPSVGKDDAALKALSL